MRPQLARGRSSRRVLAKAGRQEAPKLRRYSRRQRRRLVADDGEERGHRLKVKVRRRTGEQLHDDARHRPHVALRVRAAAHLDHLRRHPVRRPDHVALVVDDASAGLFRLVRTKPARASPVLAHPRGAAEVRQLYAPVLGREEVGALDVAVNDAVPWRVQVRESVEHLRDVHLAERLGRGSELVGLYRRRERARLAVLEHDVEVRRGPDGAQLADDVRVAERSQQVDLEAHPRERRLVDAREGYLLYRHDPSVPLVYRLVHLPVRALTYLVPEYIASHQGATPRAPALVG